MSLANDPAERGAFRTLLRARYRQDPCGVAGFALWKITAQLASAELHLLAGSSETPGLLAVNRGKLILYWAPPPLPFALAPDQLRQMRLLNLHGRYAAALDYLKSTHTVHEYQALAYRSSVRQTVRRDSSLALRVIDTSDGAALAGVARLISAAGGRATPAQVCGWMKCSAFAPELWLGVGDRHSGALLGVGISTFNPHVAETDLDWFYVHPAAQGRGIGRLLVAETVARSRSRSSIIRVAGAADGFYQRCGFVPCATWYYVTRKGSGVQWWE